MEYVGLFNRMLLCPIIGNLEPKVYDHQSVQVGESAETSKISKQEQDTQDCTSCLT